MNSSANETTADRPSDHEVVFRRSINAPRDVVWAMWSDEQHINRWWGPDGFTTTTSSFEFKPGGQWRFVMHGPDGRDYQNRVTYIEIVQPEKLVYRHDGGEDVEPVQFTQMLTFEDVSSKTRLTWRGTFPSAEERARVIKEYGADKGLVQCLARLAQFVAGQNR